MNRHVGGPGRPTVADIRRRLRLERNLPPEAYPRGINTMISGAIDYGEALLRYYGVRP